jgi:hypothetical protein
MRYRASHNCCNPTELTGPLGPGRDTPHLPSKLVLAVLHRRRAAKKVGRKSRRLLYTIVVRKPKIEIRAETALVFLPQEGPRQFRIESIVTKMAVACPHSL